MSTVHRGGLSKPGGGATNVDYAKPNKAANSIPQDSRMKHFKCTDIIGGGTSILTTLDS